MFLQMTLSIMVTLLLQSSFCNGLLTGLTWMGKVELGWGFLHKYRVYVANYTLDIRPIPSVRLQIWTQPHDDRTYPEYQLKWEHIFTADQGTDRLYEVCISKALNLKTERMKKASSYSRWHRHIYTQQFEPLDNSLAILHPDHYVFQIVVPESERIEITSKDRLGWTGEADSCPIGVNYIDTYKAYFRPLQDTDYPVVGDEIYVFDRATLPTQFSMGISVTTSCKGLDR